MVDRIEGIAQIDPAPAAPPPPPAAAPSIQAPRPPRAAGGFEGPIAAGMEAARLQGQQELEGAQAMARAAERRAASDRAAIDVARGQEKPIPAFIPTKETALDLSSLFGLIGVVGTALGGRGKTGAMQAMSAMTGMMQGYQQGRQDLYQKEYEKFRAGMEELKLHNDKVQRELQYALKLSETDLQAGQAHAQLAMARLGSDVLAAKVRAQGLMETYKTAQQIAAEDRRYRHSVELENMRAERAKREQEERIRQQEEGRYINVLGADGNAERITVAQARQRQAAGETLRPVPTGMGAQQERGQRMINALSGVSAAVNAIQQLSSGATSGMLPFLSTKEGLMNYIQSSAGRTMSSSENNAMNVYLAGIGRNLATLEASGVATGLVGLAKTLESAVYIKQGDKPIDVANKLADIREVAEKAIEPVVLGKRLTPDQERVAQGILEELRKAVPYTRVDVAQALNARTARRGGAARETVGEAGRRVVGGGTPSLSESERQQSIANARAAIAANPDARERVIQRLRDAGIAVPGDL